MEFDKDTHSMDVAYLTALSALAGSVVGGLTTGITTWMSLRSQARAGVLASELIRRQDLFRDFIVAASKAYGNALVSSEPQIQELVALYAMIGQMRVLCSSKTIACTDQVMNETIDTYFAPNKTVRELRDKVKNGMAIDPLKEFSEAAREEVHTFARQKRPKLRSVQVFPLLSYLKHSARGEGWPLLA